MKENREHNRETSAKQTRVPVSGLRDILTVYGKDPTKKYRFVQDKGDNGMRIQNFKRGGWEFTDASGGIKVGQESVYKSERTTGSIVRYPSGEGYYSYLMEINKEWYDEDQAAKAEAIDELEETISGKRSSDDNKLGQYGDVSIERKSGR